MPAFNNAQRPICDCRALGLMLGLTAGLAVAPACATPAKAPEAALMSACPTAGAKAGIVARLSEDLDLTLQGGPSLHLAGLDPPQPTPTDTDLPRKAHDALAARLARGAIFYKPLATVPDRWGRVPAFVFFAQPQPGAPQDSVAIFLLAHGLARFMPAPEAHDCRLAFLAAEQTARTTKLGLWHDPYYAVLAPTADRAAVVERAASNVIVEGRLLAVTSNRYRLSLVFAPQRLDALTVTVLQRNVAIFDRSGLNFRALIGRTLRVRGLLDLRFGPHIELTSADDVELIPDRQRLEGMGSRGQASAALPSPKHP